METYSTVAVLIPCFNEELSVGSVVRAFADVLPGAAVHVYDNNSTDRTCEVAGAAGAIVRREPRQGKGHVVRRMFSDVEADVYVLVDGDDTYDASCAPHLVHRLLEENLDMVCGARTDSGGQRIYPRGHRFGNWFLSSMIRWNFGGEFHDVLTGYRVFSRRFVKSFPCLSGGFDIEAELAIHSLTLRLPVAEMETPYHERPVGSVSKLSTVRDGVKILRTIVNLLRQEKPLPYYGALGGVCAVVAVILAIPIFITYLETGLVPRFPTAFLAMGLMLLAGIFLVCGLILDTVTKGRRETRLLAYLGYPGPQW